MDLVLSFVLGHLVAILEPVLGHTGFLQKKQPSATSLVFLLKQSRFPWVKIVLKFIGEQWPKKEPFQLHIGTSFCPTSP